ncbi:MAG: response regulator transcription factor [Thermomicrobiales bacterium]
MSTVPPPATVLVVDDDTEIADLMRDYLVSAGFAVITAPDSATALAAIESAPVDCLLLDVMMPGQSGFDLCRQVRETRDVPILFLSAREGDIDKIRGLSLGGDDYIVKSATPGEVVARVQAVLRRYQRGEMPPPVLDFGRLAIDVRAREVRVAGQPASFTAREFDLLRLLAEHPRQVFTRDGLFERFWGEFGDRHTVTVHIGRIREKIEANSAHPEYIKTVWGVGYRFEGKRR